MPNRLNRINLIVFFFVFFFSISLYSKEPTNRLTGKITDLKERNPIVGVNVYIKGTTKGTVTNIDGYYELEVPSGENIVVFSFIGYKTIEKKVNLTANKKIDVSLEAEDAVLGEVQITAQRRFFGNMDYGREIPTIKSNEIEKINSSNASDILHARVAGVWATKTSGAPGDQQKIRIRGQASFFSSAEPLYVIDGVPVPIVNLASLGIADLNMHDIENVTVLKDASSSALYGFQGGNGVILIDTKKTSADKINVSFKSGFQWLGQRYDLMNTKDFLESLDLAGKTIKSSIRSRYPEYSESLCNHDRQSEVFQQGKVQEYQLSGGGKTRFLNYYLSGNYTNHVGIIKNSEFNRYTLLVRVGTKTKGKLAVDASYRTSYQENINNQNQYMGNSIIFEGIAKPPCLECTPDSFLYNKQGTAFNRVLHNYYLMNSTYGTEYLFENAFHSYDIMSHSGSIMGRYQFSPHLSINLIESFMVRNSIYTENSLYRRVAYNELALAGKINLESDETVALLNHQVNVSYNKNIGLHTFDFLLAHRYYADNLHWQVDSLQNSLPSHYYLKNSMAGHGPHGSVIRKISSYVGHVSYNWSKRYFISAIANISRMREGLHVDYYAVFPSVSLNWNLAKELGLRDRTWLNEFNLYTNYGISGNYPLNGLSNDLYNTTISTLGRETGEYPALIQFANHKLRHENTSEFNLGFKGLFFNERVRLDAAYYSKKIGNQIIMRDIPYYYGAGKIYVNLGDIAVTGYEFDIETTLIEEKNFSWMVKGNFSKSKQKIVKLADHQGINFKSDDLLFPDFSIVENGQLGDIYGYQYLGKWTNEDEQSTDSRFAEFNGMKFLNADTARILKTYQIDENDQVVVGNSIPDFNWNLINSLRYKNLELDFVIYSSWGIQKFNVTRAGTFISGVNRDVIPFYTDSLQGITSGMFYRSSYFIDDASFIRLKNVSLRYTPLKRIMGCSYKLSLSFENLFTYTKYKGFDPEAAIFTDNNFTDNAVDRGAYPNPRSVFVSIEIKL